MINEIIQTILLVLLASSFIVVLPNLNKFLYQRYYGKSFISIPNFYGVFAIKSIFYAIFFQNTSRENLEFFLILILLIIGFGVYPNTSSIWIGGDYYITRYINIKNDFLLISSIIIVINLIETAISISKNSKNSSNVLITKQLFNILFIINLTTLILFFRTTDIMNIIQFQEGGSSDFIGNLTIIKNPLAFMGAFFTLLIFINRFDEQYYAEKIISSSVQMKDIIIEHLKMFLVVQFVVYFYLGGYSLVLIPEKLLDSIPIIYNLVQLVFLFIKMLIVYVAVNFFKNKIKEFGTSSFHSFYMSLTLIVSICALVIELVREGINGII